MLEKRVKNLRKSILLGACIVAIFSMTISTSAFGATSKSSSKSIAFKTGTIDTAAEQDFLNRTNALRASLGLGSLKTNSELLTKARAWSQTQASSGTIFHSTLTNGVTQNWYRLGENVGMGPTSPAIHDALVRSPRHYENLVDPGFTDVGIGVIREGNIIYVTQVFMQLMPASENNQSQAPATQSKNPQQNSKSPAVAAASTPTPIAEAAPLKTASPELNAVIEKLSILEA
jgi:hypothetical protein